MARHLFASALFAGLLAGALAALLQFYFVVPLIVQAELYESGVLSHFGAAAAPAGHAGHGLHGLVTEGIGRHVGTFFADLVTYTGFAFVLVAGFALAARGGIRIDGRTGLLWGLAGFAAVQLAPAMGLPPELPGSAGADLDARQAWWVMTAASTACGLAFLAYARHAALRGVAAALLIGPHLIGAPHPESFAGVVPPELAASFAARSLGVGAVIWAVLGLSAGSLWARGDERSAR